MKAEIEKEKESIGAKETPTKANLYKFQMKLFSCTYITGFTIFPGSPNSRLILFTS